MVLITKKIWFGIHKSVNYLEQILKFNYLRFSLKLFIQYPYNTTNHNTLFADKKIFGIELIRYKISTH